MSKTISEILRAADELRPNAFAPERKTDWLSRLEGQIQMQIFLQDGAETVSYTWPEDRDTQVLVQPPYDRLYELFLAAMIDYAQGEPGQYAASIAVFNGLMGEFARFFADRYRPADGHAGAC